MTLSMNMVQIEQAGAGQLTDVLRTIPFISSVKVQTRQASTGQGDFRVAVRTGKLTRRLVCEVQSNGQPRLVRDSCLRLRDFVGIQGHMYPVVIAPFLSPKAAAICAKYDVGYLDLAGNCRLSFDQVFILREGFANAPAMRRDLRSLYSPKTERVLRVLLNSGPRSWRMQELADEAEVSMGQTANVKKLLFDREWAESAAGGFRLRSFKEAALPMLKEWAVSYQAARNVASDFYSLKPTAEIESLLAENANVALTALSGAVRLAPAVRYQRVTAYVKGDIDAVAKTAGLKRVSTGANVTLLSPYDEGVFYETQSIKGAQIVSPVQLYLDLMQTKSRGEEAAKAILDMVIQPLWQ